MNFAKLAAQFRVPSGQKVRMQEHDPGFTAGYKKSDVPDELLAEGVAEIAAWQEKLYAENRQSLLVIFQALDGAGKDSIIRHVLSGVNPTGVQVFSFKAPNAEELDHDYLWRIVRALPERGRIGIHNRSHYEEVLAVRVHPAFLGPQRLPPRTLGDGLWRMRFEQINNFEKYLVENGTEIVKIYLNISKKEQAVQQLERIDVPEKHWKFNPNDIEERRYWDDYMAAFEDVFTHTSTEWAPWYIVPGDRRWFTRLAVVNIIAQKLKEMAPQYPEASAETRAAMPALRKQLAAELEA
ncbi:MAG: Polyphosphate kinase 2 (PPK2) [Chloroflexi bacterium ADurb.Bin325]|nr:MAG: Polyphosphate kinase 2 (PPK2) [Chloroflexi bacterium ADurb.Bin325]